MPLSVSPAQQFSSSLLLFLVVAAPVAWWVCADSRARTGQRRWERMAWTAGTLLALPIFLPMYLVGARPPGPRDMWGFGEIVGITLAFGLTLPFIANLLGAGGPLKLFEFSAYAVAQSALIAGLSIYVVRYRYRLPLGALGLRWDRGPALLLAGFGLGAATIPLSTAAESAALALIGLFTGEARARMMAEAEHANNPITGLIQTSRDPMDLVVMLAILTVVVPIAEETFFRGFVYRVLRERWGVAVGVLASASFFGVVHLEPVHFLPIFVLGVILAYSLERTRSLLPAIAVHAVNNLVAVFAVLYRWNI